ncbi:conserved hypothetical protein [gamma proteobacterium NOR5-3]|nr:conserved hypothetical protein [gamma proteobacterium NOR5-3]
MTVGSFEELLQDRSDYIRIARKNGFEEGLRNLLSELYPDNAHFIYEVLQNAEDARATTVDFMLESDRLVVTHDGERPFSLNDIESITSIGQSTKKDDETSIGKFGVGFKAVFAYTTRPEVRSGKFNFVIEDLFVPRLTDGSAPTGKTSFTFPFDRPEKESSVAVAEVQRGLQELDEKTLLFLSHISTINYSLPDGTDAIVMREEHSDLTITIIKEVGRTVTESKWLRLIGESTIAQPGHSSLSIAAAFQLEEDEVERKGRSKNRPLERKLVRRVVPVDSGEVCIYFPAVKEDSGLRFHVHAPFASTVARDSVRDDPDNAQLVADIGRLIVDSLPALRNGGLITDSLLSALPNEEDPLEAPYTLIRDVVIEAFNNEPITPVRGRSGAYAPAKSLISSPSEFRNFLNESDLQTLLYIGDGRDREDSPRWIRDSTGRAASFLDSLSPEEFGWDELGSALQWVQPGYRYVEDRYGKTPSDDDREAFSSWLAGKSDKSIESLYRLLGRGRAGFNLLSVKLSEISLIRVKKRGKVKHVTGPTTYLPSNRSDNVSTRVPQEFAYFDDEDNQRAQDLRSFFKAAGVQRWSESARIEMRLSPYTLPTYEREIPASAEDFEAHVADVQAFVAYTKSDLQKAASKLSDVEFLLAPNPEEGTDALKWVSPADTFVDQPFEETGFAALYEWEFESYEDEDDPDIGDWHEPEKHCPAHIYAKIEGFASFLKQLGAMHTFAVANTNHKGNRLFQSQWLPARTSHYTIDDDYELEKFYIDSIAKTKNEALLKNLWMAMTKVPGTRAVAQYRGNASSNTFRFESKLAQELTSVPWVLTREGDFRLPKNVLAEELSEGWSPPPANSLLVAIGFGTREKIARAQRESLHAELVAQGGSTEQASAVLDAISSGVPPEVLLAAVEEWRLQRAAFPELASDNPSRRADVAAGDAAGAPIHETEEKVRQIVRGQTEKSEETRTYLKQNYTKSDGGMVCQCCHAPMPFTLKDGSWYFEAVQFVPGRKRTHKANALALCPVCAAKYKHVRETEDIALIEALLTVDVSPGAGAVELPVLVAGKRTTLKLTGKHAIDLQAALRVAGEERD